MTLSNTGKVDEHGFQPLDSIFSSPQKGPASANGAEGDDSDDRHDDDASDSDSGSQAMDIPSSASYPPMLASDGRPWATANTRFRLARFRPWARDRAEAA